MQRQRKKEIYDICVEFGMSNPIIRSRLPHDEHHIKPDIIIVEDDPYYFLQEGRYILPDQRASVVEGSEPSDEEYMSSLAPSFLAWYLFPQIPFPSLFRFADVTIKAALFAWKRSLRLAQAVDLPERLIPWFLLDHCSRKPSGMVYMQPTFRREAWETVWNVDTSTLRIRPGEFHSMTCVDPHWHRLLSK